MSDLAMVHLSKFHYCREIHREPYRLRKDPIWELCNRARIYPCRINSIKRRGLQSLKDAVSGLPVSRSRTSIPLDECISDDHSVGSTASDHWSERRFRGHIQKFSAQTTLNRYGRPNFSAIDLLITPISNGSNASQVLGRPLRFCRYQDVSLTHSSRRENSHKLPWITSYPTIV
jgi:hypothetical protein